MTEDQLKIHYAEIAQRSEKQSNPDQTYIGLTWRGKRIIIDGMLSANEILRAIRFFHPPEKVRARYEVDREDQCKILEDRLNRKIEYGSEDFHPNTPWVPPAEDPLDQEWNNGLGGWEL